MREILFRPQTSDTEIDVKVRRIRDLLVADKKVKLSIMLHGREAARPEVARVLLDRIAARVDDIAAREGEATHAGRTVSVIVALRL